MAPPLACFCVAASSAARISPSILRVSGSSARAPVVTLRAAVAAAARGPGRASIRVRASPTKPVVYADLPSFKNITKKKNKELKNGGGERNGLLAAVWCLLLVEPEC